MRGRLPAVLLVAAMLAGLVSCSSTGNQSPSSVSSSVDSSTGGPPDAELYAPMMKACLEDSGWFDVEFLDDGGIKVHVAPDGASKEEIAQRQVAYQKDFQACLKQTGFDQPRQVDPKEEYRQQTEVDECLRQYGIPIKSPTFEQFQQGEYSERLSLLPKDPTKLKSLQQECHF